MIHVLFIKLISNVKDINIFIADRYLLTSFWGFFHTLNRISLQVANYEDRLLCYAYHWTRKRKIQLPLSKTAFMKFISLLHIFVLVFVHILFVFYLQHLNYDKQKKLFIPAKTFYLTWSFSL